MLRFDPFTMRPSRPGARYPGRIGALYVLPDDLPDAELAKLEGWVHHEFGRADLLPRDHPYKAAPPTL